MTREESKKKLWNTGNINTLSKVECNALIDNIFDDHDEICGQIIDMAESAIQSSTMAMINDSIHKEGLVGTLKDIINEIKETK